jgi:hypothetical protein
MSEDKIEPMERIVDLLEHIRDIQFLALDAVLINAKEVDIVGAGVDRQAYLRAKRITEEELDNYNDEQASDYRIYSGH